MSAVGNLHEEKDESDSLVREKEESQPDSQEEFGKVKDMQE